MRACAIAADLESQDSHAASGLLAPRVYVTAGLPLLLDSARATRMWGAPHARDHQLHHDELIVGRTREARGGGGAAIEA
jgi:hypothetical protein